MVTTHRVSKIAVTVCLVCMPVMGVPISAQAPAPAAGLDAPALKAPSRLTLKEPLTSIVKPAVDTSDLFAQRGWGWGRRGRHNGSRSAIILGSVATVAGAAVLVYANRPECSANHAASGCGYGTKVVGGAVVAGGVVSIAAGALTWGR
jgi:hypothetical protein